MFAIFSFASWLNVVQWRTTTLKNIQHTSPEHERHLCQSLMHTAPCTFGMSKIQVVNTINFEWWWCSQEVSWICLLVVVLHWHSRYILLPNFPYSVKEKKLFENLFWIFNRTKDRLSFGFVKLPIKIMLQLNTRKMVGLGEERGRTR